MKTIEVSDEMYAKLKELANEYVLQDNRSTRIPYLFQIQEQVKVYDTGLNGNELFLHNCDGDEYHSIEDLKEYYDDVPEDIDDLYSLDLEYSEWIDNKDLTLCSYSLEPKYRNAFFTAKACKEHIEANHYHYSEPRDYLNHAWRNPEMELISDFLVELSKDK